MAWITVDQKLIGGKLRDFAKRSEISQNEAIGILIRLWLWGIDNTEENGRLVAAECEDVEEAIRSGFMEDERCKIPRVVTDLIESGWIDEKEDGLYLHDWTDWRGYYTSYEQKKAKHAERMRDYRAGKKSDLDPEKEETGKTNRKEYTVAFEEFWKMYPRKVDKGNAYKKYQARLKDGYSEEDLLTAATNYANQCKKENTETKFIKHPKTFLSDAMPFTDFLNNGNGGQQTNTPEPQRMFKKGENPFK